MLKTQIYIVQVVGIILLLCGYFLSDQPDSLSVMHFNPTPDCQSVISKPHKSLDNLSNQIFSSSQNNPIRKSNVPKFISHEAFLPVGNMFTYPLYTEVGYDFPLPENYAYLFFEEINPPPPKSC